MIVIFMCPFHYYAYMINHNPNCLEIQHELYGTFAVVAPFNTYMLIYIPIFIKRLLSKSLTAVKVTRFFFTQIPVLLVTLTMLPNLTTGTRDWIFFTTTNLFLFGYVLLVTGLSLIIKSASEASVAFAGAKWAKAVFNLLFYLHGGHLFGAVWYCFVIDRVLACWREDYFARNKVDPSSFICGNEDLHLGQLNCPNLTQDGKVIIGFGIFHDAINSGAAEMRNFVKKFLYCLLWGLQILSCFSQNLEPSTSILENIYVISVVVYSTVLCFFNWK
ncbi:hypothetical protein Pint_25443 [Pistacia integerrima]|uniref:Uncharacterized protein n=1 Tax=Pistacia integerrima TaxID=434235 RepID=A0ACC0YD18_9ROSI|nr:hypothetical protein Pint_25443 [Pistacia integerrima]